MSLNRDFLKRDSLCILGMASTLLLIAFSTLPFVKQWGLGGSSGWFTFPLALTVGVLCAIAVKRSGSGNYAPWTADWSKTGLNYGTGNNSAILVLGY